MKIESYSKENRLLVAVDCIIFGFNPENEELQLLLIKRDFEPQKGKWSLMGGFLKQNETVNTAARRVLFNLTGLKNVYMEEMKVFSKPDRDPVERTVSVAFYALINIGENDENLISKYSAKWYDLSRIPKLIFDHNIMVKQAIMKLRHRASLEPVGFELLPEKFTMRHLIRLHEEIFNEKIDSRNFIKKMNAYGFLEKLHEKDKTSSRKGSFLYRFKGKL